MELEGTYHHIQAKRMIEVESLITAYYYPTKTAFKPYFECFDFSQIIYVTSGSGVYITETDTYRFDPGMMFFRPAGARSKYEWETEHASFAVISFCCPSEALQALVREPFLLCEEESNLLLELIRTGVRIFEPYRTEGMRGMKLRENASPAVLSFIFASLERFLLMVYCRLNKIPYMTDESQKVGTHINDSRIIGEICEYLSHHLHEKLTVEDICSRFWISRSNLNRKFRRETGQGVIDYFIDMKLQRAKSLIRSSSQSFTEISDSLGFSSAGYFSKTFKAKFGMTPPEYSRYASKQNTGV